MRILKDNLATVVAAIVVAGIVAATFVLFGPWHAASSEEGLVAIVHDGEGNERRLPLAEDATLEVVTSLGRNVVVVEGGTVRIAEADCPKQSCTQQQPISQPGQQLICLPHKLWVEIVDATQAGDGEGSSKLDANAVTWNDEQGNGADVDLVAR